MTLKATFLTLLVIVIWSSNFIAIKLGVSEINPLVLLSMRFALAGLIFLPFMKWPGWRKAGMIALVGIIMGPLHQGFLFVGLTEMSVGLMSILLQANIIIVTLIGWLFFKENVGWRTWTGILIGIIGIVLLVGLPGEAATAQGYILAAISTVFLALNYIGMKKLGDVHPPTYIALLSLPVAPIIMIASFFIEGTDWITTIPTLNWGTIIAVVLYQAIVLSLSHMIWQRLIVQHPVSQIIPWTLLVPVFAVAIAALALDEPITLSILSGGLLTILGVTIITFRRLQKKQA